MKSTTETQDERICRIACNLAALAKRQEVEVLEATGPEGEEERIPLTAEDLHEMTQVAKSFLARQNRLFVAAIDILLLGRDCYGQDFCDTDFDEQLNEMKESIEDKTKAEDETAEDESSDDSELIGEQLNEQQLKEKYDEETIDYVLDNCRKALRTYRPTFQQDVLGFLQSELPEMLQEQQEEEAQQAAVDDLINAVYKLPEPEQTPMFRSLLEQVKNRKAAAA